jgi:hypothetical protein
MHTRRLCEKIVFTYYDRKIILIKTAVLVKQEGPAYLSGTSEFIPRFSGVHVAQSLVFCVLVYRSLFSLFLLDIGTFSFGHYVVCSSLIYGF